MTGQGEKAPEWLKSARRKEQSLQEITGPVMRGEWREEPDNIFDAMPGTHEVLPRAGMVSLSAEPKSGKSTLCAHLALSMATEGVKTLFIAAEGGKTTEYKLWRWQEKRDKGIVPDNILNLAYGVAAERAVQAEILDRLSESLVEAIIIDSLIRAFSIQDENDNAELSRTLAHIREWADRTNSLALIIHHTRKGSGFRQEGMRGASEISAITDENLVAKRERNDSGRSIFKVHLAGSRLRPEGRDWCFWEEHESHVALVACAGNESGDEKIPRETVRNLILKRLRSDRWVTRQELMPPGIAEGTFTRVMQSIVDDGIARERFKARKKEYILIGEDSDDEILF